MNSFFNSKLFVLFISCLLLSSCSKRVSAPLHSPEYQAKALTKAQHFRVSGRIGFRNKQQGNSAAFHWQQAHNRFAVKIQAPLAAYTMKITGHPGYIWIQDSKGENFKTQDPKAALQAHLGWFLPIEHLKYWLSGRNVPNSPIRKIKKDKNQTLLYLNQNNWDIYYLDHQNFHGFWLPKRMILKQGSVQIKFIFKRWNVG